MVSVDDHGAHFPNLGRDGALVKKKEHWSQTVVPCYILYTYIYIYIYLITYGPHKAVAEVSNHNEPIGRKSGIQLVRKSMDFTFNCFVLN